MCFILGKTISQQSAACNVDVLWKTALCLLVMTCGVQSVLGLDKEMTVNIEAGREECFYQHIREGSVIDIEYQVIDGTHGELDISFKLEEPSGRIIYADYKKSENGHRADANMSGDYKFCFDNTFSSYNMKTVFFELVVEGKEQDATEDVWGDDGDMLGGMSPDEILDIKVQDLHDVIYKVRNNLNRVQHLQDVLKSHEARDRNIAEENFFRVNTWSVLQITVMLLVGLVQVIMLKSLFDNTSKAHSIWKKLTS